MFSLRVRGSPLTVTASGLLVLTLSSRVRGGRRLAGEKSLDREEQVQLAPFLLRNRVTVFGRWRY